MTLANAMVLVDQTAVPLTLAEIMRTYDVGVGAGRRAPERGHVLLTASTARFSR
jgi:hypothetical protein